MSKPDGGQAFPKSGDDERIATDGMTLRDYFAAQAVAGLAQGCGFQGGPWKELARDAYAFADAMMVEREKP